MYPQLRSQKLKTMRVVCYSLAIVYFALRIVGCGGNEAELSESKLDSNWHLQSSAFAEGGEIPEQFTCEGADISPALSWSDPPSGTQSLALLMDDPDAPGGTFTHWILYNLSPNLRNLDENLPRPPTISGLNNANQGRNDFGKIGYGGPCPPRGSTHHYRFRLFAIDTKPALSPEAARSDFFNAIEGHVLAEARLTGLFGR